MDSLLQKLIEEERLEEAVECKNFLENNEKPPQQLLQKWANPNNQSRTIKETKEALLKRLGARASKPFLSKYETLNLVELAKKDLKSSVEFKKKFLQQVSILLQTVGFTETALNNWVLVLNTAIKEVDLANSILEQVSLDSEEVINSFYSSPKTIEYLKCLNNIWKVSKFVCVSILKYKEVITKQSGSFVQFTKLFDRMDTSWSKLEFRVGSNFVFSKKLNAEVDENDINSSHCVLCGNKTSENVVLEWKESVYHDICLNFWVNKINNQPPLR